LLGIIAAWVIASIVVWLMLREGKARSLMVSGTGKQLLTMAVQIVCGDCAGNSERPIRTMLDQSGRCFQCGGASYVLASDFARNAYRSQPYLRVVAPETVMNRRAVSHRSRPKAREIGAGARVVHSAKFSVKRA
jgi:hypothetical protein